MVKVFLSILFIVIYHLKRIRISCKNFLAINHKKSVLLPEEGEYVNYQNFKRLAKVLFIIYGDFECVLIASTDNIHFVPKTK